MCRDNKTGVIFLHSLCSLSVCTEKEIPVKVVTFYCYALLHSHFEIIQAEKSVSVQSIISFKIVLQVGYHTIHAGRSERIRMVLS
jgi:hypothetical protein